MQMGRKLQDLIERVECLPVVDDQSAQQGEVDVGPQQGVAQTGRIAGDLALERFGNPLRLDVADDPLNIGASCGHQRARPSQPDNLGPA